MKRLFILSAALLMFAGMARAQSQTSIEKDVSTLKKDIRADKAKGKSADAIKKDTRKALHEMEGEEVTYQAQQAFEDQFDGIKATSEKALGQYDEFDFTNKKGASESAFFNKFDGKLVGTTEQKSVSDLPETAMKYINKHYADYKPVRVTYYDSNEYNSDWMLLYNFPYSGPDSYFVELEKGNEKIVLQVSDSGDVNYFARLT